MSTMAEAASEPAADPRDVAPAALPPTRPLYWSVRRELWEHRSIHLAPLAVVVFLVAGLVTHGITMPSHLRGMLGTDPATPGSVSAMYSMAAGLLLLTAFAVGAFYCLEALGTERRDRSILFWKSLPVSDRTTVLAKAAVPLVVLPAVTFAAVVVLQLAMFLLSAAALLLQGHGAAALWRELHLFRMWLALLYTLPVVALWHAPVYCLLLLVSGWARRTAALWVTLPLLAAGLLEKLTMNTTRVPSLVLDRLLGWHGKAFLAPARGGVPLDPLASLTPGRFLGTPGLWIGLAFAALFLAAAVRLRRYREPV
jgi:ABC-2 type transport system permease protein